MKLEKEIYIEQFNDDIDEYDDFKESYGKPYMGLCQWKKSKTNAPYASRRERMGAISHCNQYTRYGKMKGWNKRNRLFWEFHNNYDDIYNLDQYNVNKSRRHRKKKNSYYTYNTQPAPSSLLSINTAPRSMIKVQKNRLEKMEHVYTMYHQTDKVSADAIELDQKLLPSKIGIANSGIYFAENARDTLGKARRYGVMLECKVNVGNHAVISYYGNNTDWKEWQSRGVDSLLIPRSRVEWLVFFPEQVISARRYNCNYEGKQLGPIRDMNLFNLSAPISQDTWRYCIICCQYYAGYCRTHFNNEKI